MSNVGSSSTYHRPKGETTEWEDIHRKLGNFAPLEDDTKAEEESEDEADAVDPLEYATKEEIDELDEEDEFADSRFLDEYRKKRIDEMKALAAKEKFGSVLPLIRADFVREVSDGSKDDQWVVVHLHQSYVETSNLLGALLDRLAPKHKATKFMRIRADQCIDSFPDKNVPALIIYHDGEIAKQVIGAGAYGADFDEKCVEWVLADIGAVNTELEEDPRKKMSVTRPGGRGLTADSDAEEDSEDDRDRD